MATTVSKAIAELRQSLEAYGPEVKAAVRPEARKAAQRLYSRLAIAYPTGPTARGGRKVKGRTIGRDRSLRYGLRMGPVDDDGYFVVTSAPHAHLFEYGTGARKTSKGANRGTQPAKGPVFKVFAAQERADMVAAVQGHLRRIRLQS